MKKVIELLKIFGLSISLLDETVLRNYWDASKIKRLMLPFILLKKYMYVLNSFLFECCTSPGCKQIILALFFACKKTCCFALSKKSDKCNMVVLNYVYGNE